MQNQRLQKYKLIANSPLALSYKGPDGPHLSLSQNTKLGRLVDEKDGYPYPVEWTQISSVHCRIYAKISQEDIVWFIEDTSTNGTYVNLQRVPKYSSVPLKVGDHIRLCPAGDYIEYIFSAEAGDSSVDKTGELAQGLPSGAATKPAAHGNGHTHEDLLALESSKKRARTTVPSPSPSLAPEGTPIHGGLYSVPSAGGGMREGTHATVAPVGAGASASHPQELLRNLAQLERHNQDLRRKLDASRSAVEAAEGRLQAAVNSHREEVKALEARLEGEMALTRERNTALSDAVSAEVAACKRRTDEAVEAAATAAAALEAEREGRTCAERDLAQTRSSLAATETEVSKLQAKVADMVAEAAALRTALEEAASARNAMDAKMKEALEASKKAQEEAARALSAASLASESEAAARSRAESLAAQLASAMDRSDTERRLRRASEEEVESLRSALEECRRKLDAAEEKLAGKSDRMLVCRAQIRGLSAAHSHAAQLAATLSAMMGAIGEQFCEALSSTLDEGCAAGALGGTQLAGPEEHTQTLAASIAGNPLMFAHTTTHMAWTGLDTTVLAPRSAAAAALTPGHITTPLKPATIGVQTALTSPTASVCKLRLASSLQAEMRAAGEASAGTVRIRDVNGNAAPEHSMAETAAMEEDEQVHGAQQDAATSRQACDGNAAACLSQKGKKSVPDQRHGHCRSPQVKQEEDAAGTGVGAAPGSTTFINRGDGYGQGSGLADQRGSQEGNNDMHQNTGALPAWRVDVDGERGSDDVVVGTASIDEGLHDMSESDTQDPSDSASKPRQEVGTSHAPPSIGKDEDRGSPRPAHEGTTLADIGNFPSSRFLPTSQLLNCRSNTIGGYLDGQRSESLNFAAAQGYPSTALGLPYDVCRSSEGDEYLQDMA